MSIRIVCPNCHMTYNATDDQRGQRVRCRQCQAIFRAAGPEEGSDLPAGNEDDRVQEAAASRPAVTRDGKKREESNPNHRPPRKKATRKIPPFALFLIIGGVGGSLLIVAASAVVCVWLWKNPPETWRASKTSDPRHAFPGGRNFAAQPPDVGVNEAGDGDGKEAALQGAEAAPPPPPPPRELEFASPLPKEADPPEPPKGPANPQLPPELVQKVKRATVYLRVTLADGKVSQGSGFFGVESNIVLTNAHVLGMLRPDSRRPQKVEAILNSGAGDERKLTADLLGVDRNADLAVLRVRAPDLPPPLPVRSARNLQLTQQVYVFGFPFGADLGKEITVSQSSVSSLRWENGMLTKVQVNGGMHPGNSGGPVVDAYGNVVGVAVSVLRFTQINFAVPGDQVYAVLHGRISSVSLGQPFRTDTQVNVPAKVQTIDPLAHIREPALEIWIGEPTPPARPPSMTPPRAQAGDSPHQRHPLKYHEQVAQAEIPLPLLPPGKVYWIQPRWTDAAGETWWATANVYPLPPPVQRKPVPLVLRHQVGSRPLVLNSWLDFKTASRDGAEHNWTANAETSLTETTEAVDAQELASIHLQYRTYNVEFRGDNQDVRNPGIDRARQTIKNLAANLRIDKQGNLVGNEVDFSRVPDESRPFLAALHEEHERALASMIVPLPNKQVSPGESWKAERTLLIPSFGRAIAAPLDMTYTYVGTREHAGHEEAVLDLKGEFRALGSQAGQGTGRAEGVASVDLSSGQVTQADMVLVFDVETHPVSRSLPSGGKLTLRLRRNVAPGNGAN
jgi:S1-C subfamily serine protease